MAYGMKGHIGICFQQSFGTAFTSSMFYLPFISESIVEAIPAIVDEAMRGRYEEGDSYEGYHEIGGDIVMPAHPILTGLMLKAFMGQASGTLTTSHYVHTFKPRTIDWDTFAAVPPMTIEVYRDAGSAHQYYDVLCSALSFEYAHNALIKNTMSIIGGKFAKLAKSTPSYVAGSNYSWHQASVAIAGVAATGVSALTVNMDNALEAVGTLNGTKTPARILRSDYRKFDLSGTMLFENDTEFDIFRAHTEQRITIGTLGQLCNSGVNCKLDFDFPSVRYNEFPPQVGGPGKIEVSFSASVKYNAGSATAIAISLVNTQSAY